MLKEKLGLCPYEVICNEEDFILIPEIQDDIEELKRENKVKKIVFGVDMSSSFHIDNKKNTLILGIGPTQGLENTLTAEKIEKRKK